MKISKIQIFEYQLPLCKPLTVHKTVLTVRSGLLLMVTADNGAVGVGEIAPLEGYSADPLKKTLHQAKTVRPKLIGCSLPVEKEEIRDFLSFPILGGWLPSVRCGFEMAFVHLAAVNTGRFPCEVLTDGRIQPADVTTAALLQGTPQEVCQKAARLYKEGRSVFKLKVGSKNIPLDVKKVNGVREVIGQAQLRLDANAAWRLDEAVAFGELVGPDKIQFIEDPIMEFDQIDEFYRRTQLPVALDESLGQADPAPIKFCEAVRYFVVKPMVVGGLFRALEWMAKAEAEGRGIVISSCFESSVGLSLLANLARLTPEAAGLGTAAWFGDDLLETPLVSADGIIRRNLLRFDAGQIKIDRLSLVE